MGMLPPKEHVQRRMGLPPGPGANSNSPLPPTTPVIDPTMQGGSVGYSPGVKRERAGEDRAPSPQEQKAGGPPNSPGSTTNPGARGITPLVVPNQYVDPLLVQRLLAKARTGYAGTFLTGPRGVPGLGGGR